MRVRKHVCVVVDGYSTGTALAQVFAGHGVDTVHVRSAEYLPDVLTRSLRPADYVECLDYDGDLDRLCADVTAGGRQVRCVVPGAETGVLLADALAERFGCPGNGTSLSAARRDKSLMSAVVSAAGLRTIPQLRSGDPARILAWADELGFAETIVKPPASSGTYGFHICDDRAQLATAVDNLLGSHDIFGTVVSELIAQPYVRGTELCVNTVSLDGLHLVSDVWLTRKRRSGPANVYDQETLLPPGDRRWSASVEYVSAVLDALQLRYGPSHTEVMLTDDGPVLIESAARMMGSLDTSLVVAATGTNAILLTASAYLTPQRFMAELHAQPRPVVGAPALVQMLATQRGKLVGYGLAELAAIPSFYGCDTYLEPGDEVVPTVNSYTSPGLIFLYADSEDQLATDYLRVRELERCGRLYQME